MCVAVRAVLVGLLATVCYALQQSPKHDDVRLDFPDTVELKIVVDYIAASLQLNLTYDDEILQNKKLSVRAAQSVARKDLLGLLRTLLRGRGFALIATGQSDWLRIIPLDKLAAEPARFVDELSETLHDSEWITYPLPVPSGDLVRMQAAIAPHLTKPGSSVTVASERRALLITDFVGNLRRARDVANVLDSSAAPVTIEELPLRHRDPVEMSALITRLLAEQERHNATGGATSRPALALQPNTAAGGLFAFGQPEQLSAAKQWIQRLDVPREQRGELYTPKVLTVPRLRGLIEQLLGSQSLKMVGDESSRSLLIYARPDEHRRIREVLEQIDSPAAASATPMRLYKLSNRRAADLFVTLASLIGDAETPDAMLPRTDALNQSRSASAVGVNLVSDDKRLAPRPDRLKASAASSGTRSPGGGGADSVGDGDDRGRTAPATVRGNGFALSVDEHTNTIIAFATPEIHEQLKTLIAQLDKRRPQVLVEVTLVSVTVDDSLNLGVELQALDLGSPWDYLLFTAYGMSSIDPTTGARRLTPMTGGSGALIAPDEVPLIIQALESSGRTRVYSAPRILVDDNATGRIESVAESPFTSVNASTTVATTSFAGFAKAGTQLSIEPHIAEGDHLEIKYDLTVSSFTGASSGAAPPPRSSDTISSTIRVPDAYTVVVGGLLTETLAESTSQVPLIGDVPGLGFLFGSRSQSKSKVRLYAFIRPTILRREAFEDLRYLSESDLKSAEVPDGFPPDRFSYMR